MTATETKNKHASVSVCCIYISSLLSTLAPVDAFAPISLLFAETPSLYIFGASMVDGGQNAVAMPTRSRAEFAPYGLDYFTKPQGRWSNGRTFVDLLSQELGYGLIYPYLKSVGSNFTYGVNFASSGSTAQNSSASGNDSAGLFCLLVQVEQFMEFQGSLLSLHPEGHPEIFRIRQHFSESIFFFETAHNDYLQVAFKSEEFNAEVTVQATIASMKHALEALYESGARIFIVMNVTPLGCAPSILSNPFRTENRDEYGCKIDYLHLVNMHNMNLSVMLNRMRDQYPDGSWILFDAYNIFLDGYHNPANYGIKYPFQACCGAGGEYNYIEEAKCGISIQFENGTSIEAKRCEDPSLHLIWDSIHPVESFSHHIVQGILSGSHLYPAFNITENIQRYCSREWGDIYSVPPNLPIL